MITEDYISFETAKLLKDKGFDVRCKNYFSLNNDDIRHNLNKKYGAKKNWNSIELCVSRPSQSLAMKWLREVHRLSIEPYYNLVLSWVVDIKHIGKHTDTKEFEEVRSQSYNSYEQACEAAIKYCLENLI